MQYLFCIAVQLKFVELIFHIDGDNPSLDTEVLAWVLWNNNTRLLCKAQPEYSNSQ